MIGWTLPYDEQVRQLLGFTLPPWGELPPLMGSPLGTLGGEGADFPVWAGGPFFDEPSREPDGSTTSVLGSSAATLSLLGLGGALRARRAAPVGPKPPNVSKLVLRALLGSPKPITSPQSAIFSDAPNALFSGARATSPSPGFPFGEGEAAAAGAAETAAGAGTGVAAGAETGVAAGAGTGVGASAGAAVGGLAGWLMDLATGLGFNMFTMGHDPWSTLLAAFGLGSFGPPNLSNEQVRRIAMSEQAQNRNAEAGVIASRDQLSDFLDYYGKYGLTPVEPALAAGLGDLFDRADAGDAQARQIIAGRQEHRQRAQKVLDLFNGFPYFVGSDASEGVSRDRLGGGLEDFYRNWGGPYGLAHGIGRTGGDPGGWPTAIGRLAQLIMRDPTGSAFDQTQFRTANPGGLDELVKRGTPEEIYRAVIGLDAGPMTNDLSWPDVHSALDQWQNAAAVQQGWTGSSVA